MNRTLQRILVVGNSASGKSTFARGAADRLQAPHLDLDTIAWNPASTQPERRALADSQRDLDAFTGASTAWVLEGCYADLLALALHRADTLVFLNPGTQTCLANARQRPWEPHKYATPAEQDANLDMLLAWIADYEQRDDELSYAAHRRLFDGYAGHKLELRSNAQATDLLRQIKPGAETD